MAFTSLQAENDFDLPKGMDVEQRNKSDQFPLDCFGVIMSYIRATKDLLNLIYSCKQFEQYAKFTNPSCVGGRRRFTFVNDPKSEIPYVKSLNVEGVSGELIGKKPKIMSYFPNLEYLYIAEVKNLGWKPFSYITPKLLRLEIDDCPKLTKNTKLSHLKNLRYLSIDFSHNHRKNELNLSFLIHLHKLEKLILTEIKPVKFEVTHFQSLQNLVVLEIGSRSTQIESDLSQRYKRSSRFDSKMLQYTQNLEELGLDGCHFFGCTGFQYLKKLKKLQIYKCRNLKREAIEKQLGQHVPNNFSFTRWTGMKKGKFISRDKR